MSAFRVINELWSRSFANSRLAPPPMWAGYTRTIRLSYKPSSMVILPRRRVPDLPHGKTRTPSPKAIVAPHIDFHRGGPAYAWAYKSLAESDGADLYIILGTSHCGGENPFILTLKDFETPLGLVETDKEFVKALHQSCQENLFADEYLHRGEHSVEFQAVLLKFIKQRRAELRGEPERPFKIVPILVSSFHPMVQNRTLPERHPPVARFIDALQDLASREAGAFALSPGWTWPMSAGSSEIAKRLPRSFSSGLGNEDNF